MPFKKGQSGNPNGRPKGKGNKLGTAVKGKISDLIENIIEEIESKFDEITLSEKIQLLPKLTPYILARKSEKMRKISFKDLTEDEAQEVLNNMLENLKEDE